MIKESKTRGATPKQPATRWSLRKRSALQGTLGSRSASLRNAITGCAVVLLLTGGWHAQQSLAQWMERFPIRQIKVMGDLHYVDRDALDAALRPYMNDNFFMLNLDEVRETTESMTWIDLARVRKEWPQTLVVSLQERIPVANWGKKQFLSAKGEIFFAENVQPNPNLPTFIGMAEQAPIIAEHYVKMQLVLREAGLSIQALEMTDRVSMTLQLSSGLTLVIDEKNSLEKLQRFTALYHLFSAQQQQQLLRVDLRYENGLAIKWKKGDGDTNAA